MIIEISVPHSFFTYAIEIYVLYLIAAGEEKQSNFTDCINSWQAKRFDMGCGMWDVGCGIWDCGMGNAECGFGMVDAGYWPLDSRYSILKWRI